MDIMRQIRDFRSNFENISRACRAIVARLSYDSCETFVRLSHDVPTNVALVSFSFVRQSRDIRESVSRHSYECRLVLFSPQIVARTVARLSYGIRTTIVRESRNFCIVNFAKISRRHVRDTRMNVVQLSHDSHATVLRHVLSKKSQKVFKHV